MRRIYLKLASVFCVLVLSIITLTATAQYRGARVDSGQQYWNNHWQWHKQNYSANYQRPPAAGYQGTGHYYSNAAPTQKPFANARPAPTAFQKYGPLMVYPNSGLGYWY